MSVSASSRHRVLVLNKLWTAVSVVTFRKACRLLYTTYDDTGEPKARVIVPSEDFALYSWSDWAKLRPDSEDSVIRTAESLAFKIPEVILLTRYEKMPHQRVNFSRRSLYRRDDYRCQYCSSKPGIEELNIDHILPRSRGGLSTWENCVISCFTCNAKKKDRTPEEAGMKLLSVPQKPKFSLFKGDKVVVPKSWEHFVSEIYWDVPLKA